jgi:hypothetical protein
MILECALHAALRILDYNKVNASILSLVRRDNILIHMVNALLTAQLAINLILLMDLVSPVKFLAQILRKVYVVLSVKHTMEPLV